MVSVITSHESRVETETPEQQRPIFVMQHTGAVSALCRDVYFNVFIAFIWGGGAVRVCMYVYDCVCTCVCSCTCVCVCSCASVCVCVSMCMCVCPSVCSSVCLCVCARVCLYYMSGWEHALASAWRSEKDFKSQCLGHGLMGSHLGHETWSKHLYLLSHLPDPGMFIFLCSFLNSEFFCA